MWHAPKKTQPPALTDIQVTVEMIEAVEGVYWASPDGSTIRPEKLEHEWVEVEGFNGKHIRFTIPRLEYWSMIYIQTKHGAPAEVFIADAFPQKGGQ
ncbi:Cycloisomaltooligosaccharide glucanotransferase precursor [compost metagenome]